MANFNEICPTRTLSIRPASQTTFKYVLGVGFGTSGADGVVGPSGSPDGITSVLPSPLSPGVPVSVVINSLYRQIISSRCSTELHSFYSQ